VFYFFPVDRPVVFTKNTLKIATTVPYTRPAPAPRTRTTQQTPSQEFDSNYHQFDEDGNDWPKPRPIKRCNTTTKTDDDVIDDITSIASSVNGCVHVVIATLVVLLVVI